MPLIKKSCPLVKADSFICKVIRKTSPLLKRRQVKLFSIIGVGLGIPVLHKSFKIKKTVPKLETVCIAGVGLEPTNSGL